MMFYIVGSQRTIKSYRNVRTKQRINPKLMFARKTQIIVAVVIKCNIIKYNDICYYYSNQRQKK